MSAMTALSQVRLWVTCCNISNRAYLFCPVMDNNVLHINQLITKIFDDFLWETGISHL